MRKPYLSDASYHFPANGFLCGFLRTDPNKHATIMNSKSIPKPWTVSAGADCLWSITWELKMTSHHWLKPNFFSLILCNDSTLDAEFVAPGKSLLF